MGRKPPRILELGSGEAVVDGPSITMSVIEVEVESKPSTDVLDAKVSPLVLTENNVKLGAVDVVVVAEVHGRI